MLCNLVSSGQTIDYTPAAAVKAGDAIVIGSKVFIAPFDCAAGATLGLPWSAEYTVPKASATTFSLGAAVYWDATNQVATATDTGNTLMGVATKAAVSGELVALVRTN